MEVLHDTDRFSSLSPTGPRDGRNGFALAMEELAKDPEMAQYFETFLANAANAAVLLNADPPEHRHDPTTKPAHTQTQLLRRLS